MGDLLKGKVAIVTGGSRGIGKAIAQRFAKEGCDLVLASRTKSELEKTAQSILETYSVEVSISQTDISNEDDVDSMVNQTIREFGRISILVNNAAVIGPIGELSKIKAQEFLDTLTINIGGTFFCSKAVIPHMKSQNYGCIINLSGGGGLSPHPYYDAYSASKAAIVRLTENIAIELEKFSINVTAISPGAVNTDMFSEQLRVEKESIGEKNWEALQDQLASGGESIDRAAELALCIARQSGKAFNGRVISAIWDDWDNIESNEEKLVNTDVFQMRRIVPRDRGMAI